MGWDRQAAQAAWDAQMARERELAARLAEWIEAEGIAKGDEAAETADALSESEAMRRHAAVLLAGGEAPQQFRDAAIGVACIASMTGGELAAELFWHGHDPY